MHSKHRQICHPGVIRPKGQYIFVVLLLTTDALSMAELANQISITVELSVFECRIKSF